MSIGCGDEPLNVATLQFHPEYDYMDGYDVFPDGYDYAAKAFKAANTNFSPYYSEKILVEPGIATVADIYEFVEDNAECYLDEDLQCVRIDSTLKKLEHILPV